MGLDATAEPIAAWFPDARRTAEFPATELAVLGRVLRAAAAAIELADGATGGVRDATVAAAPAVADRAAGWRVVDAEAESPGR